MNLFLPKYSKPLRGKITITGSKSESNRLLILQQFYKNLTIENLGESDDTKVMKEALLSTSDVVDVHHAGTAMRFLTAYFALITQKEITITGSERMQERPIKILVDALLDLGAQIEYLNSDGFPPLKIKKSRGFKNKVAIKGDVSSQYISALMLVAPQLPEGLEIELFGEVTSIPYIKMTQKLLLELGIEVSFEENFIKVKNKKSIDNTTVLVESDWSSASYFYSLVALSDDAEITLSSYKKQSLQGDAVLAEIYKNFGVKTVFKDDSIVLSKVENRLEVANLKFDLKKSPDIAQTIAVTCFGLGKGCELSGLHTLKIKETDRLVALKTELEKLGAQVLITDESLVLKPSEKIKKDVKIATYNDHRMAMAFAPLLLKTAIEIEDAGVVSKSFPTFWDELSYLTE